MVSVELPILAHLDEIAAALKQHSVVLLSSPPGTGKTTALPPYLAQTLAPSPTSRIVMLEPRRLAALRAAEFIRENTLFPLDAAVVGHRVRGDSRVSGRTALEVQTYGVFNRIAVDKPDLADYSLVIFDEAHERSIDIDLAFAQALEALTIRPSDLKLLVMSATLNIEEFQRVCPAAPVISIAARQHPVSVSYLPPQGTKEERDLTAHLVRAVASVNSRPGDLLVFLPGKRELTRATEALSGNPTIARQVVELHGELPLHQQRAVLVPQANTSQRIILSTAIAETSVTVPRVHTVIDAGLSRIPRYDAERGLPSLETVRVSSATAEQRAGRAGRLGPGVCLRLWPEHEALVRHRSPEILEADLIPLVLTLAASGISDYRSLRWLSEPKAGAITAAKDLLRSLGALDREDRCTEYGRALQSLALHPRLAHLVLTARRTGQLSRGAQLAVALSERRPTRTMGTHAGVEDLGSLLKVSLSSNERTLARDLENTATSISSTLIGATHPAVDDAVLIAAAFPDRIGYRVDEREYLLSGGPRAVLPEQSNFERAPWLLVTSLQQRASTARAMISQAGALDFGSLISLFPGLVSSEHTITWSAQRAAVVRRRAKTLGAIQCDVHEESAREDDATSSEQITAVLLENLRIVDLPISPSLESLLARVRWLTHENRLPDQITIPQWVLLLSERLSAEQNAQQPISELEGAVDGLRPFLQSIAKARDIDSTRVVVAIEHALGGRSIVSKLTSLAPETYTLPGGREVKVTYEIGKRPLIRSRLQDFFGTTSKHPTITNGAVPLRCELLSPAGRPVQVTEDLPRFWTGSYQQVRKEMKSRYPKHNWPERP